MKKVLLTESEYRKVCSILNEFTKTTEEILYENEYILEGRKKSWKSMSDDEKIAVSLADLKDLEGNEYLLEYENPYTGNILIKDLIALSSVVWTYTEIRDKLMEIGKKNRLQQWQIAKELDNAKVYGLIYDILTGKKKSEIIKTYSKGFKR